MKSSQVVEAVTHRGGVLAEIDEVGSRTIAAASNAFGRGVRFVIKASVTLLVVGFLGGAGTVAYLKSTSPASVTSQRLSAQYDLVEPNVRVASSVPATNGRRILDYFGEVIGVRIGRSDEIVERRNK